MSRPCLGFRARVADGVFAREFTWLTYKEVFKKIQNFGFGLRSLADPRDFVGISAKNSVEWYVADFACYVNSFVGPVIPYNIGTSTSILYICYLIGTKPQFKV